MILYTGLDSCEENLSLTSNIRCLDPAKLKICRKSPLHNSPFWRGDCCEVQFFVNLESGSRKLGSENTKMYFKLLSDILTYTNKHTYYFRYIIV